MSRFVRPLLLGFLLCPVAAVVREQAMTGKANDSVTGRLEDPRLNVAPSPFTVRYAPGNGSLSSLDPPAFVWLPVPGAHEYVLEYSRLPEFPPERTVRQTCKMTVYVPRQNLGAGGWYWRFGIRESDGRLVLSRRRAFTIARDAARVPFPDLKAVVANLAGVRPRDFIRAGTPGWAALEILTTRRRHLVAFRTDARPGSILELGGQSLRGDVCAICLDADGTKRASFSLGPAGRQPRPDRTGRRWR